MAPRESQERVKPSEHDDCRHGCPDGGLLDPPSPPPFSSPELRRYACRLPVPSDHDQQELLQSRLVAAGSKDGTRPERDGTIPRLQNQPHQCRSQMRVTSALHRMQDHLQQTMVISHRQSQKTHAEQAASRTNGNAAYVAVEAATQAR